MKNLLLTNTGTIGASGRFYPCTDGQHRQTTFENQNDRPHVCLYYYSEHEAYALCNNREPTNEQFETVIDWCTKYGFKFEDVAICPEWAQYLEQRSSKL